MTEREWKQYSLTQEVRVDRHLIWTILKLWVKRKTYRVTISFYAQHNSETKFNSVQVEYKE
jgi:hypothetical protein